MPPDLPGAYDRYGFRVPAVIVSPYAKKNYVSHVVHDHTSILKLIETKWNLPALTYRDANADNLLDSLDFTGEARVPRAADASRARAARVGRGRRLRRRGRPLLSRQTGRHDPAAERDRAGKRGLEAPGRRDVTRAGAGGEHSIASGA